MQAEFSKLMNHSLECIAKAQQASETASRLQKTSRKLREQAAELISHNRALRQNSLAGKLRLHEQPDLLMSTFGRTTFHFLRVF